MSPLRALRNKTRFITSPAPLEDFPDYDAYWDKRGDIGNVLERWRVAADLIPDGSTVLDVGCGSGEFLEYLRTRRPDVRARGADFSAVSVEKARARGFEAFRLDLEKEQLPEQYDYITCFEVLEHIPDAEQALRHLQGAFRERLIVSVPNVGVIHSRLRLALGGRFPVTNCIFHMREHVRHWTPRDFREWAAHYGLRVLSYRGQYGGHSTPWRRYPGLFAFGLVYELDRSA